MAEQELPYRRQKTPRVRQLPYSGSIFLTTVYPTSTHGAHGNSGGKSAGKDVFASGKGRKCPETSGDRYSQILWDQVSEPTAACGRKRKAKMRKNTSSDERMRNQCADIFSGSPQVRVLSPRPITTKNQPKKFLKKFQKRG